MAVELDELREEVRVWREADVSAAKARVDTDRLARWRAALKTTALTTLGIMALADSAGRVVEKSALVAATRGGPGVWQDREELSDKFAGVLVCLARVALRRLQVRVHIETVWGLGYCMSVADAARLLEFIGEQP